jgi:phage host-nuclease inhibitor protein Gam
MQENVSLIKEINDLRRELKQSRTQVHDLEAALGLHRKNNQQSRAAADALTQATSTNKNALMELELTEKKKIVDLQQNEIIRLRNELADLEKALMPSASRPSSSGGRLPPVVTVGGQ